MVNINSLKADFKQILRDPILILFLIIPVFIFILMKVLFVYFLPFIGQWIHIDLSPYYGYIMAIMLIMTPDMLGTVTGFLMIDDRDGHIMELVITTPIGISGYLVNRLMLSFGGGVIYTWIGYWILDLWHISYIHLSMISLLIGVEGIIITFMLYILADDKVKGVTYSKALGMVMFFTLADLLNEKWISILAGCIPFYWISRIVNANELEDFIFSIGLGIIVHLIWLYAFFYRVKNK